MFSFFVAFSFLCHTRRRSLTVRRAGDAEKESDEENQEAKGDKEKEARLGRKVPSR